MYDYYSNRFHSLMSRQIRPRGHCKIEITPVGGTKYTVPEYYIETVSERFSGDPISRELPEESCTIVLIDYEKLWHPDNPDGRYHWFDGKCQIDVSYGIEDPDNSNEVEYGASKRFYTVEHPEWADNKVTINCEMLLGTLTMPYYQFSTLDINNGEDLLYSIFRAAGISYTKAPGGRFFDTKILASANMGETTVKDALLLTAQATNSGLMSTDEVPEGVVLFGRQTNPINTALLTENDYLEPVAVQKLPILRNEVITRHDTGKSPIDIDTEDILDFEETFESTNDVEMFIPFSSPAYPASISTTITGATLLSQTANYNSGVYITFRPNSTTNPVTIKMTGKPLDQVEKASTIVVDSTGEEDDEFDNPLVTSTTYKSIAANRAEYLQQRDGYGINYRGDPSIDVYDAIRVQLPFAGIVPCIVLEKEFTFDGAFHGTLFVRKLSGVDPSTSAIAGLAVPGQAVCGNLS